MRFRRAGFIALIFFLAVGASNAITSKSGGSHYSQSYPSIACPASGSGLNGWVSVQSTSTPIRKIAPKSTNFVRSKYSAFSIKSDPILINSAGVTSIASQSLTGTWSGATLCSAAQGEQWFVGGTADVSSKGYVHLVNSGLSDAIVDITAWSENGPQVGKVVSVKGNSSAVVPLDVIAAGQSRLVLRVTPRAGSVTSFLIDQRSLGLKPLGGDIVNSAMAPSNDLVITGIPHQIVKGVSSAHILRIVSPGLVDANVRVDLISTDGVFVPVGLDAKSITQGVVTDITLSPTITSHIFSLRIHSDQPVEAGVYSLDNASGHRDFVWSTSAPALAPMTIAVNSLNPIFYFTGDKIEVSVSTRLTSGKVRSQTLVGTDVSGWIPPKNSQTITITHVGPGVFGSVLLRTSNGISSVPLAPSSKLTRASVPRSDIAVINR